MDVIITTTLVLMLLLVGYAAVIRSTVLFICGANLITFAVFGLDKLAAKTGRSRVPERFLWLLCIFGGAAGALIAMLVFRHKTQKKAFHIPVVLFFVIQLVLLLLITCNVTLR